MRYTPYESEYAAVPSMSDGELLDYFLLRVVETEEVWGLSSEDGWLTYPKGDQTIMPLWPYERYASDLAEDRWQQCQPVSVSLEYFVYENMERLIASDTMLEVLPRKEGQPGCLVSPHRLLDIIEGIMDAGEYTLDS